MFQSGNNRKQREIGRRDKEDNEHATNAEDALV
jgi:hypothetical protein